MTQDELDAKLIIKQGAPSLHFLRPGKRAVKQTKSSTIWVIVGDWEMWTDLKKQP